MIVPTSDKTLRIKRFYRNHQCVAMVLYDAEFLPWRMREKPGWQPSPPWWATSLDAKDFRAKPGKVLQG